MKNMGVKKYSMRTQANHALSAHFAVREFACRGGGDVVLIDDRLVSALEALRRRFGRPVLVSSGYRSLAYNTKIGGAKNSQHMKGTAADVRMTGVAARDMAVAAEDALASMGIAGGVGLYEYSGANASRSFCHVDVRDKRARWLRTDPNGKDVSVQGFGGDVPVVRPTLKRGARGKAVTVLQTALGIAADGIFGPNTEAAVRAFQAKNRLAADGVAGPGTWAVLMP